jgi:hypothetical protein
MTFMTIGFMAESGHGKDFCGNWVRQNKNFVDLALADPIKRFCMAVFKEFDVDTLWGETRHRNAEIQVDWAQAEYRLEWHLSDWVASLTNLTVVERAAYKPIVKNWFQDVKARAGDGPTTARLALQLLGTEYGRHFRADLWTSYTLDVAIPHLKKGFVYTREGGTLPQRYLENDVPTGPNGAIITDVRFGNELAEIQKRGGFVVKLVRLSKKGKANTAEEAGIKNHVSEAEIRSIPEEAFDLILEMEDGADVVYPRLEKMFAEREFENRLREGRKAWTPPTTHT